MSDEVERLRPAQQTLQEINLEAADIDLNTDDIETQQIDGTQQTQITDGTTLGQLIAVIRSLKMDLSSVAGTVADVNAGGVSAGSQRVTIATDDINLAILTAAIAVASAAAPANVSQVGGEVETTVPTEEADGTLAALILTSFRELVMAGYNRAMHAQDISPVSAAKIPALIEDGWVALEAAGDETPPRDTRLYATHTIAYDITMGILTSMDLIVWGSIDGTLWLPLASFNVLGAGVLEDSIKIEAQVTYIKCELEAVNDDGSVVFQLSSGNKA